MDEPTVGVDPQARASILEVVRAVADSGTAVIYTTHYFEEAERLCDHIGIIDHGKILAEGTLADSRNTWRSRPKKRLAPPRKAPLRSTTCRPANGSSASPAPTARAGKGR